MIIHENRWNWGETATIVRGDGAAIVELSFENNDKGVCYLHSLSVLPNFRKKGFGRSCMEAAENYCRHRGIFRIDLCAVQESWLLDFYHKLGYVDVKEDEGFMRMYKMLK